MDCLFKIKHLNQKKYGLSRIFAAKAKKTDKFILILLYLLQITRQMQKNFIIKGVKILPSVIGLVVFATPYFYKDTTDAA